MRKIIGIFLTFMFLGCSLDKETEKNYIPETEAGITYKAFLNENLKTIDKGMKLFNEYGLLNDESRSIENFDIIDFVFSINPDEYSRSRKVKHGSRSGEKTEVTLEEELQEIVNAYTAVVEQLAPNGDDAIKLDSVEKHGDVYFYEGNMVIDPKSIDGALTLEILNAQARGEDTDLISKDIEKTITSMFEGSIIEDEDSRGHYVYTTFKYSKGKINYFFDSSVSKEMRTEVREAMKDWEKKTNKAVTFHERTNKPASMFLQLIGSSVVKVTEENLKGAYGEANLGRAYGAKMRLNPIIKDDEDLMKRVPRHELGHIIGLSHEHQRWDRDKYIKFDKYSDSRLSETKKMNKNTKMFRLHVKKIRTWFGTIRIPYIWYDTIRKSFTPTPYDYNSIMHYHSGQYPMRAKLTRQGYKKDEYIKMNSEISNYDAYTVKKWY